MLTEYLFTSITFLSTEHLKQNKWINAKQIHKISLLS